MEKIKTWNENLQELVESEKENYQSKLIRVDLTQSEIDKVIQGEAIQTQYSWLKIGKILG